MNTLKSRYSLIALAFIAAISVTACGNPDGGTNEAMREETPLSPPPNQEQELDNTLDKTTDPTLPPNQ